MGDPLVSLFARRRRRAHRAQSPGEAERHLRRRHRGARGGGRARASVEAKAAVIHGAGEHFSAGLDIAEHAEKSPIEGIHGSRRWHAVFDTIQRGAIPFVAALHGAVVGGGLELAASTHIRVADRTAFFALPEGQRGIFVGGSGSVRIARLMTLARMTDLMLTGRVLSAEEGERFNLVQYLVEPGAALDKAKALARRRRRQRAAFELRHHQRAAAHPGYGAGRRALRRVASSLPSRRRVPRRRSGCARSSRSAPPAFRSRARANDRRGAPRECLRPPRTLRRRNRTGSSRSISARSSRTWASCCGSRSSRCSSASLRVRPPGNQAGPDRHPGRDRGEPRNPAGHARRALRIKRSNMAKIVRMLVRDGLIQRLVPSSDRRARGAAPDASPAAPSSMRALPDVHGNDRRATTACSPSASARRFCASCTR